MFVDVCISRSRTRCWPSNQRFSFSPTNLPALEMWDSRCRTRLGANRTQCAKSSEWPVMQMVILVLSWWKWIVDFIILMSSFCIIIQTSCKLIHTTLLPSAFPPPDWKNNNAQVLTLSRDVLHPIVLLEMQHLYHELEDDKQR